MRKIFVSDYDGTITNKDFYALLAERYVPADAPDYFAQYMRDRMTHFDAMAAYFAFMPTEEQQIEQLLDDSEADPDLGASAARLQRGGWGLGRRTDRLAASPPRSPGIAFRTWIPGPTRS